MENAEEILHSLEVFTQRKSKIIPPELNNYLSYVARTGDPFFQWSLVKNLFKEKLLSVLTDFHENSPGIEIPSYPNVDPFDYDTMKNSLLERLDTFLSAPFTLQRICELLINPRNQYNRIDKLMRAIEKNILVVSTREPGPQFIEQDNGEPADAMHNGSNNKSDSNIDVEMEEVSWQESRFNKHKEPCSSNKKSDEDNIDRDSKSPVSGLESHHHEVTEYESITPPDHSVSDDNDIQDTDSTEKDKANDSNNSAEVAPKPLATDFNDEEEKTFVIPKIVIHTEMADLKESTAEVNKSNSDSKEEIANEEATPAPNDVKTQVTPIETEVDIVNEENIAVLHSKEDISQDDDKINLELPDISKIDETVVEKSDVLPESISGTAENEAAVMVIDKVPEEPSAMDFTAIDIDESLKLPSITYLLADSQTKVDSTDSTIEADAKDDQDPTKNDQELNKNDQDFTKDDQGLTKDDQDLTIGDQDLPKDVQHLAEAIKDVADDKQAIAEDDKILADADQTPDKLAESSELIPDSST